MQTNQPTSPDKFRPSADSPGPIRLLSPTGKAPPTKESEKVMETQLFNRSLGRRRETARLMRAESEAERRRKEAESDWDMMNDDDLFAEVISDVGDEDSESEQK